MNHRKSVIVRRDQAVRELQIELQVKNETQVEDQNKYRASEFVVSLNIHEIENLFTVEEGIYFDNVRAVFDQKWNTITFGEEMMSHYIGFCKQRHQLPTRFFQLINNQLQ